jgi:hypothetical protein
MTTHVMTHERPIGRHATNAVAARNGMAGGLPTGANDVVHSRVLSRCVERLTVKYGSDLEAGLIRRTVQQAYRELEASARLRTFLPLTAANLAESRLRGLAGEARAGRHTVAPTRHETPGNGPAGTTEFRERAAA